MKHILSIFLLIFSCNIFEAEGLRCVTSDGLQVEDVRKVIKKCMKKITVDYDSINSDDSVVNDDDENEAKNYDEYESEIADDDYEMRNKDLETNGRRDDNKNIGNTRRNNGRMNNYSKNYTPTRLNHNYDYPQTGGNYYEENRRNDRHDPSQYNPYQFTYNHNNNFNNQRGNFYGSNGNSQNKNNDNSTDDTHERDRSCILQCFFQEFKMVNDDGFPDRNKMTNVMTKNLRDKELKNFYIDSIQECFRMVNLDLKLLRDNCLYSRNLITCLAERAKMNCADWNTETVIF